VRALLHPLTLAVTAIFLSFGLSNLYRLVPGGDVNNLVAALRVDGLALLLFNVYTLFYILVIHPVKDYKWAGAKILMAVLLMLQAWESVMKFACKIASNPIAADALWGTGSAKGACSSMIGPGPLYTQIVIGFTLTGWILWRLHRTRKT
jgi:hypothetical protein